MPADLRPRLITGLQNLFAAQGQTGLFFIARDCAQAVLPLYESVRADDRLRRALRFDCSDDDLLGVQSVWIAEFGLDSPAYYAAKAALAAVSLSGQFVSLPAEYMIQEVLRSLQSAEEALAMASSSAQERLDRVIHLGGYPSIAAYLIDQLVRAGHLAPCGGASGADFGGRP